MSGRGARVLVVALLATAACGGDGDAQRAAAGVLAGGDAARGRQLMREYGCGSCHVIPGVIGAHGRVGPPLDGIADRRYLAGSLPNTPEEMLRWIQHPRALAPNTAMPEMGVRPDEARDMASHLYTLRD